MMQQEGDDNQRSHPDPLLSTLADYVIASQPASELAYRTACHSLMDALGCAILALQYPACSQLLGPVVPGTRVPVGARVPGTAFVLDPILAAFNIGTQIRWLDFNDTWLAAEWGHPSDNLGAILAVSDYVSRKNVSQGLPPLTVKDVLGAMIQAYEIQGVLALNNSFNRLGFDHVILVKLASAALATRLLGGMREEIIATLSQCFLDGCSLRAYRQAPNTGSRKSWAAGDACSRAVRLSFLTLLGEEGYPHALTAKKWGFQDTLYQGKPITLASPLGSYIMENILFKVSFPAEFHAQTAVECAIKLHPLVHKKIDQVASITITTHESAMRIINKVGPLHNPADRDHSLQYMVAIALLHGDLTADHYEDHAALDPRIDQLREKMQLIEEPQFSKDYLDPQKRSIANAVQVRFQDGSMTEKITIEYPIGHVKRREESIPLLYKKFETNLATRFEDKTVQNLLALFQHHDALAQTPIHVLMDQLS